MKINQIAKSAMLMLTLFGVIACSSTSEEVDAESVVAAPQGETDAEATARRAREQAAAAATRASAAEERMMRSALNTTVFYFDFDVAEFRPADRDVLTFHARDLAANSRKRIRLEGHADERGTREYNLALGERRGSGILNYFIVNGASRSQIEIVSYGEERPADRGTNEAAYQRNRRVEIVTR